MPAYASTRPSPSSSTSQRATTFSRMSCRMLSSLQGIAKQSVSMR